MSNIDQLTYRKYEEYSTIYLIHLGKLNDYILELLSEIKLKGHLDEDIDVLIEQWIQNNCYYILITHNTDDFNIKLTHNLQLAKQQEDYQYINYISSKLNIKINEWVYIPNKIKIRIKQVKGTITIGEKLAQILEIPKDTQFKYKSEIIRLIHKYIYDHQLQNRYDRKTITPNDQLLSVMTPLVDGEREYTYDNLPRHIDTS